jgi:tRNA threonylcarbamoyladenosine biosynthesis protein TsaB
LRSDLVLGVDTSGPWCRAALLRGGEVLSQIDVSMPRGQVEALMPLLDTLLAGHGWQALSVIGVGTGPGNFTGTRIGVAAVRGLALGLGVRAIGVTRFQALALDGPDLPVLVPGPAGQAWICAPGSTARAIDPALAGQVIAEAGDAPDSVPPAHPLAIAVARIAAASPAGDQPRPAPLYLRPADAAPAAPAPALLE